MALLKRIPQILVDRWMREAGVSKDDADYAAKLHSVVLRRLGVSHGA